ncbi:MAG: LysR family transcriptional regulator [Betaproteobacteria bacterium]|nr:LysR family transcriptional regulator [Betaproteobacteria bacterium]
MNITSRQLKAFLLTAQHQSFSRAAEQLFITQSGISVLIRKLEDQLGARLFERTTRRVSLTEFGSKFLPIANRNLLELDVAAASMGRAASAAGQRLAIGSTPLIAKTILPAVIREYAKREPQLDLILHDGNRSQLIEAVNAGEIDLALGCFLQPVPEMRRTSVYRFTLMWAQPQAEPAPAAGKPVWEDLVGRRLLGAPPDNPIQMLIDQQLQRVGRREPPEMRFNFFETHIAMVASGAGVAVLPTFCIPACRDHGVATFPLVDPVVPIDLFQITARGHKPPPGAAGFTAFVASYIAEWAEPWSTADAQAD